MGIFNHELKINKDEPLFENDKLGREKEIIALTSSFKACDNQMVLALNAPWGTGKTSFLKLWDAYLRKNEYCTVFFNCWENDFVEDPFIAFVEEIKQSIMEQDEELIKDGFSEKALKFISCIPKKTKNVVVNIGSDLLQHHTGVNPHGITIERNIENDVNDIDNYQKTKQAMSDFKDELKKIAKKCYEKDNTPLVIFVDELDRCRPNFAIEVLERIKHVFNVENIIFILGIDKEELSNSVKIIYGENTKVNGYLNRFIDLEANLQSNEYTNKDYIKYLLECDKFEFELILNSCSVGFILFEKICINTLNIFNFPYRELEKIVTRLYFVLKSIDLNSSIEIRMLTFLVGLNFYDKDKYKKFKENNITTDEIFNNISRNNFVHDDNDIRILAAICMIFLDERIENDNKDVPIQNLDNLAKDNIKNWYNKQLTEHTALKIKKNTNVIIDAIDVFRNFIF